MIACRGCRDHSGTGPLCHLNRHASHATSGPMNEKRLPTGKPCVLKKRLPGCQSNQGDSGCLYVVLATWDIRSEKSNLRAIYWSHSVCGREAAEVESESMHVFHTLIPFSAQRRILCSLFSSLSGND